MKATRFAAVFTVGAAVLASGACAQAPAPAPGEGVKRVGQERANPRTPGAIRLATYNIENLFDERAGGVKPGVEKDAMPDKPAADKREVANAIRAIDADVVALEEVGSLEALLWFRDEYLKDAGYEYVVSLDSGDERGIEQAVLSRFPVTHAEVFPHLSLGGVHPAKYGNEENWHAGEPLMGRRSPLLATVEIPPSAFGWSGEAPWTMKLLVVHHKSGKWNDYWRTAEAKKFVELADAAGEGGAPVAVLGDFNAQMNEAPLRVYREAGYEDLFHWSERSAKTLTHASERGIDFILMNGVMRRAVVDNSAFVYATPLLPRDADWRTTPNPVGYASDHMPVVVDLKPAR